MTQLKTIQVEFLGDWRDVWLYKNRVLLWDRSGKMLYADVDAVQKYIVRSHGPSIAALTHTLIFRNDWKAGDQLRIILRAPAAEAAFLQPFSNTNQVKIVLPSTLLRSSEVEEYGGPVLDTCIYANRVYFATPDGLLETYFHPKYPDRGYSLNQQTDFRVSRLAVRYAAINAAAESAGLFFARVQFSDVEESAPGFRQASFRKIADYSLAISHASRNLLNYTGASVPSLYRAQTEEATNRPSLQFEEQQVVGYEAAADLKKLTYRTLRQSTKVSLADASEADVPEDDEAVEVLGNSNYHLLSSWRDHLRVIDIMAYAERDIEARPSIAYAGAAHVNINPKEILETYSINGGFVVELDESLHLITPDGGHMLLDEPVARVRTFSGSRRHKEALAVVQEESASLLGFYKASEVLF